MATRAHTSTKEALNPAFTPGLRDELEALKDPIGFLEGLFTLSPVPYALFRAEGSCLLTNPAYRAMFGGAPLPDYNLLRDELLGSLGFLPAVLRALGGATEKLPVFSYDPTHLEHGRGLSARRVSIACTLFPLYAAEGEIGHLVIAYQDVTAELEAKAAAEKERDLLRAIVAQSGEGIIVSDEQGVLRVFNRAAERQHGSEAQQVRAEEWASTYRLLDLEGQLLPLDQTPLYRAVHGETVVDAQWQVRQPDGRLKTLEGTATPLKHADDRPAGGVLVSRDVTERRRFEEELRLHSRILDNMVEGVSVADASGTIVFTNAAQDQMFGYRRGGLVGRHFSIQSGASPEGNVDERFAQVRDALASAGKWTGEWASVRQDGTPFTTRARITSLAIRGEAHWVCVQEDITHEVEGRARADALAGELRQSEEHFRYAVELNPQVSWTASAKGVILGFAERWLELTGMTREEAFGEGWMQAPHPDDRPRMVAAWQQSLATGKPYDIEYRVRLAEGGHRWMRSRAFPRRDAFGAIVLWYGTTEDIHERKEFEAALQESERLLREWVENLPELAWSARPDGHIDYYNRRWYEYTGTRPEQMEGWGWQSVHHPDEFPRVLERWQQALREGMPVEFEFPLRRADGVFRWFLTRARPVRNAQGTVVRWLGINTDIDDQQRQAEVLRQAVEARNNFLSIASHELKTPLTPLTIKLQALARFHSRQGGDENAPVPVDPGDLELMLRQVRRLGDLVDDLLDVSRISTGQLRLARCPVDLSLLVQEVVARFQPQAERSGCALLLKAHPEVRGMLDPMRLEQVVSNLLSNALKYGAGRPVVVVLTEENGWAKLEVRDEGIGIATSDLVRIFERFERAVSDRHYGGFGLGLYLIREIARGLGGEVSVKSEPGAGATFRVDLPLMKSPNPEIPRS